MSNVNLINRIQVDDFSATPKYLQLSNSILSAVESGYINQGQMMPSINDLSTLLSLSRGTVEKGYRYLLKINAIKSHPGKGYYLSSSDYKVKIRVCLLFNKLSPHKMIIYESFIKTLGNHGKVDLFVYHNSLDNLKQLLINHSGNYTHYVVIPHFLEDQDLAPKVIGLIPREKLILLDKKLPEMWQQCGGVFENFEKDIYRAFIEAQTQFAKYEMIKIIFPKHSYYPSEILKGFTLFCKQYNFNHQIIDSIKSEDIKRGTLYISVMEEDLVILLEKVLDAGMKLGKDVGVISYNETPLKRIVMDGITTISTDFNLLGSLAAQMVIDGSMRQIEVPFHLKLRASV